MISYTYINFCFLWISTFYAELVKKLLSVTFIVGFESLIIEHFFVVALCAVRNSSYVHIEPADRMVDWYQAPGSVDRAV